MDVVDEAVSVANEPEWLQGLLEVVARGRVSTLAGVRTEFGTDRWHASAMPEVVVQAAGAYQDLLDRVETIEAVQRGFADVKARRTKPARDVFNRLRRKHGIPR